MDGVTLGIGPKDIVPGSNRGEIADPTGDIGATTDVLEPMGDEIFIYLLLDGEVDIDIDVGRRYSLTSASTATAV